MATGKHTAAKQLPHQVVFCVVIQKLVRAYVRVATEGLHTADFIKMVMILVMTELS